MRMIPRKQKPAVDKNTPCGQPGEDFSSYPILLVPGWDAPHWHTHWIARQLEKAGLEVKEMKLPHMAVSDMRSSATMVRDEVERMRERTRSERVSMVGYSLGGLIERSTSRSSAGTSTWAGPCSWARLRTGYTPRTRAPSRRRGAR